MRLPPDAPLRGELYGHHPPLSFWLMRPLVAAFGLHEWSIRAEGIVFSALTAALLAWLAGRTMGQAAGLTAALVFAALPIQFRYGLMAGFEPPTLFFGVVAQTLCGPFPDARQ